MKTITCIFAFVTMAICYPPLCAMPQMLAQFCHKLKYLMIILAGGVVIYNATHEINPLGAFITSIALFFVVWPRVLWWLRYRVADYVALHFPRFYFGVYTRAMAGIDRVFGR